MKVSSAIITLLLSASFTTSLTLRDFYHAVSRRDADFENEVLNTPLTDPFDESLLRYLEKRRGGGGGSRGGSGSGSSGSTSSGSSGSSGGSRPGSGSSSGSSPSYGGGRYYAGGAKTPYRSGGRSPAGLAPYALGGAALGIFPGLWIAGAYGYNFNRPYRYRNSCDPRNNNNTQDLPVVCLCERDRDCGCDDDGNTTYIDDLVGNGCESDQDPILVHVGDVNGTKTVVINGTIPYDGEDSEDSDESSSTSGAMRQYVLEMSGYWIAGAVVLATVLI